MGQALEKIKKQHHRKQLDLPWDELKKRKTDPLFNL
jgi:hypothetical protein